MSFFSNKLKELRKLYGLKQDDIAEIMGVSRQIIWSSHNSSQNIQCLCILFCKIASTSSKWIRLLSVSSNDLCSVYSK